MRRVESTVVLKTQRHHHIKAVQQLRVYKSSSAKITEGLILKKASQQEERKNTTTAGFNMWYVVVFVAHVAAAPHT